MQAADLRLVDFSVASLIVHNPGITSRQLCGTLGMLPSNLAGRVNGLKKRGLIIKRPHPNDGRATGLHATAAGAALVELAEAAATELENEVTARLTASERKTLIRLLQKVYLPADTPQAAIARNVQRDAHSCGAACASLALFQYTSSPTVPSVR